MDKNIFLAPTEQDSLRKVFNQNKIASITDFLSDTVEKIEEGKDWAESLVAAAPWLKEFAVEGAKPIPFVGAVAKLIAKWLEPKFNELAAIACTLAYQAAVRDALTAEKSFTVDQYRAKQKIDAKVTRQIRSTAPAELADLSTLTLDDANNHIFVRRADRALEIALDAAGYDAAQQAKIFNRVHDGFVEKLRLLLSDSSTKDKFEPLKNFLELGNAEKLAHIALATHAEYQREQYEAAPVFRFEPFALKHVYVETECGVLDWQEIRDKAPRRETHETELSNPDFSPFDEKYGGRHNLVEKVMGFIRDEIFHEPIVLQGDAGAGKSSFTIRVSAELLKEGFYPIRVRLKHLQLGRPLIEALPDAIELGDEDRLAKNPLTKPNDLLLGGRIFEERYGTTNLCRYVLILDGWDELSLSDNRGFRENVQDMLKEVRETFFRTSGSPRVRVIVTGRPSEDVIKKNDTKDGYSYFLTAQTKVLTLRKMRPDQLRQLVERMKTALETQPIHAEAAASWQIPDLSRFEEVFQAYKQDFEGSDDTDEFDDELDVEDDDEKLQPEEEEIDPEPVNIDEESDQTPTDEIETDDEMLSLPSPIYFRNSGSLEVLGSPLLAYLAIRVMAETDDDLTQLINQPTRLYRELTDLTCGGAGKYVADKRDKSGESNDWWRTDKAKLRQLLQRTAAAMTITGQEYISKDQLLRRVFNGEDAEADNIVDEAGGESALSKLMISFFFKGGHPDLGCEFSHKSFREYLTAERIIAVLIEFGRASDGFDFRRRPKTEQDFPVNDDPRHDFSRKLSELLAPQWLKNEVVNHLEEMLRWEIQRAKKHVVPPSGGMRGEKNTPPKDGANIPPDGGTTYTNGGATNIAFRQWEQIRDGLADLWEWWVDGAHLRPQWEGKGKKRDIVPAYVHELIKWTAPLDEQEAYDQSIAFESATTMDAHLGDGLFRLCAWVHFFVAEADGWLDPRKGGQEPTPEQLWEGVSTRKKRIISIDGGRQRPEFYGEGNPPHPFQTSITQDNSQWRLFAPSGDSQISFYNSTSRINSVGKPAAFNFPVSRFSKGIDLRRIHNWRANFNLMNLYHVSVSDANLDGATFYEANLNGASLVGTLLRHAKFNTTSLNGANFTGANLDGADLREAINLTQEQIASAWIDEDTLLPEGFEELKQEMLERQRQQMKRQRPQMEEIKLGVEDGEEAETETDESPD